MKLCPRSGQTLPFSEFHSTKRRSDGLAYSCEQCASRQSEQSRRKTGVKQRRQFSRPVPPGSRWCPDCDEVKPLVEFARTTATAGGYHSYCLRCHNARGRETRDRLDDGSREYHLRRRYGIGQEVVDELSAEQGAGVRSVARLTLNTSITIIAPGGCAGYCASTATAVSGSSVTVLSTLPARSRI